MTDPPAAAGPDASPPSSQSPGWWARWNAFPLYARILAGVVLGVFTGLALGNWAGALSLPSKLVLRLLGALAAPLILLAIIEALLHAKIPARKAARLFFLLVLNTVVAILIGLTVANVIQPGRWTARLEPPPRPDAKHADPLSLFLDNIPSSVLGPFASEGKVIGVIFIAVAFGIALRQVKQAKIDTVEAFVSVAFRVLIVILHWIVAVIPLAVWGIVASIIGTEGFGAFFALGGFVLAVLLALVLQTLYYLTRIRFGSWVRPLDALRGTRDALVMAFSTASSTATMPVTYSCLRTKVGLREQSASLGSLVGANFNNDGTALYEAMAVLFIGQMLGMQLGFWDQVLVVLTSVVASVGAAGIPEAGLVTMTLVFRAVGVDVSYIPLLLTVDWFLDRCRTAVNVMGDVNVSCLLDGKVRDLSAPAAAEPELASVAE